MKYHIYFNQETWQINVPEAKINEIMICIAIESMCKSIDGGLVKTVDGYTFISSNLIIKECPVLGITSKSSLTPYLKKLKDWGLIDIVIHKRKQFMKMTPKYEQIFNRDLSENEMKNKEVYEISNTGVRNNERRCTKNRTQVYEISNAGVRNFKPITNTNITDTNITNTNIKSGESKNDSPCSVLSIEQTNKNLFKEIILYLNEKAGKSFKHNTNKTKRLINARVKEGFTLDDFKAVIDKKVVDWKDRTWKDSRDGHQWNGNDLLRPQTLFSGNFESYLNQETKQEEKFESLWG